MSANWLDRVPAVSAAITAVAVVLSVTHEWGYFLIVGGQWRSVLGLQDYVALAIDWLPRSAGIFFVGIILAYFLGPKLEAVENAPKRKFWHLRKVDISSAMMWLLAIWLIEHFLFSARDRWLYYGVTLVGFIWILWAGRFCQRSDAPWTFVLLNRATFILFPAYIALTLGNGISKGNAALDSSDPSHIIYLKDTGEERLGSVLRTIERGIIVYFPESENIQLIAWDQVTSIAVKISRQEQEPRICAIWPSYHRCEDQADEGTHASEKPKPPEQNGQKTSSTTGKE